MSNIQLDASYATPKSPHPYGSAPEPSAGCTQPTFLGQPEPSECHAAGFVAEKSPAQAPPMPTRANTQADFR